VRKWLFILQKVNEMLQNIRSFLSTLYTTKKWIQSIKITKAQKQFTVVLKQSMHYKEPEQFNAKSSLKSIQVIWQWKAKKPWNDYNYSIITVTYYVKVRRQRKIFDMRHSSNWTSNRLQSIQPQKFVTSLSFVVSCPEFSAPPLNMLSCPWPSSYVYKHRECI